MGFLVAEAIIKLSIVRASRNHSSIFAGLWLFKIEQISVAQPLNFAMVRSNSAFRMALGALRALTTCWAHSMYSRLRSVLQVTGGLARRDRRFEILSASLIT